MKRIFPIGILMITLWIPLLSPTLSTAEEKNIIIIKLATLAPKGSSWMKTFNALNSEVMQKTENKVQFKIYPDGVLGDETDMLRKIQMGQIQGAALSSGGLSVPFKEIDVLQIPFLFQTYEEVDSVLNKMDSFFRKGFENNGYILLGWSEGGFVYLMSNSSIASVSDLKKAKVWIWEESPMSKAIFDEASVSAIPLSVPDVLVGLQTRMVDVVYAPPSLAISLQWFTKIKYLTDVPLVYLTGGIVVNKETFKQIPSTFQNILMETSQRHLDQLKRITRKENQDAIKVMMKNGVKIITPSQGEIEEFKKLSSRAMRHIKGQTFSKSVFDEITSLLEDYRRGKK